ncbi:MAG: BrnT family toxin [Desulfobaccales bacterium]
MHTLFLLTESFTVHTIYAVEFEWDPAKARENLRVHGVNFAVAAGVFEDGMAMTKEDPDAEGERRFITLGLDSLGRLLVAVFTCRGENLIRLISARKATRKEAKQYAQRI